MAKSSSSKKSTKSAAKSTSIPPSPSAPEVLLPASAKTSSKLKSSLQKAAEIGTKMQTPAPAPIPAPEAVVPTPEPASAKAKKKDVKEKSVKVSLSKSPAKLKKPLVIKESKTSPPVAEPVSSARRILFITAECTPLAQTGGLGDAVAGLSKALLARGNDVRIVMPLYQRIDRHKYGITFSRSCCVPLRRGRGNLGRHL